MLRKILGTLLLLWGLAVIPMTYYSPTYDEETYRVAIVIAGIMCIVLVALGAWLLKSGYKTDKRPRMFKVYRNRRL